MNKFKYYFILIITSLSLFSCTKTDPIVIEPVRDYIVQYTADNTTIEQYLKTNYITITNNPGATNDQDVVITSIPAAGTQASIWSYLNNSTFPKLLSKDVSYHAITYKMYYLVLREGTGQAPCNVDGVLAAYKGDYLTASTDAASTTTISATKFEEVKYPQQILSLFNTIVGWGEVFPKFKTGTYTTNTDGTISYSNFGAGVVFIPSGLGYYSSGSGMIPSYSPLVFSFKLYEIQRLDQDSDGIPSYLEDVNGDGYVRVFATGVVNPDDTDADEAPNFLDVDDDGDGYTTKLETKYTDTSGAIQYYSFANIPDCSGNTTNLNRIKKHLDKNCR